MGPLDLPSTLPEVPLPHPVMTSPLHWSPSVSQAQRGRQPRTRAGATCAFLDLSQDGKVLSWGLSDHQWQVLSVCWGGPLHTGRRRAWPEDGPTPAPGPENGLHEPRRPPGQGGPGSRGGSSSMPQRRTAAGLGSWGPPRPLELLPERPQSRVGNQGTGGCACQVSPPNLAPVKSQGPGNLHNSSASAAAPSRGLTSTASRV